VENDRKIPILFKKAVERFALFRFEKPRPLVVVMYCLAMPVFLE